VPSAIFEHLSAGRFAAKQVIRWALATAVSVSPVSGCGTEGSTPHLEPSAFGKASLADSVQPFVDARCKIFAPDFVELVACERANGTLGSFGNPKVGWRVRYFVRYWEMPCGEAPTEHEGYVFHLVTSDLYDDPDLNGAQRRDIRDAMFDGKTSCRSSRSMQTSFEKS
jgi:hypothetical protein